MKPRRFIVVDKRVSREASQNAGACDLLFLRYYGRNGWARTVKDAGPFESEKDAASHASKPWQAVRPVRPAGTKRARAAAKAASSGREDSHSHEDLGFSVIPTAELLHGEATGSYSSCVPWEKIDEYATWLEERVDKGWRYPMDMYDTAVRVMAKEAVAMWRKRRAK